MGYRGSKETSKWFKDWRTVVGCPTTPLVINGALYGPQEVNWSTSTKRNRGRSQSVVCARLPSEVSDPPALMKENACLSDRRKYTALMVVACVTAAYGKRLSEPF